MHLAGFQNSGGILRIGQQVGGGKQTMASSTCRQFTQPLPLLGSMITPKLEEHTLFGQPQESFAARERFKAAAGFVCDLRQDDVVNATEFGLGQATGLKELQA